MRKIHRWLSVLFGIFLLWIAGTGVLSQIVPIVQRGGFEEEREGPPSPKTASTGVGLVPAAQAHEEDEAQAQPAAPKPAATAAATPAAPAPFVCPPTMNCRPKPPGGGQSIVGLLHHLHSGESFGPVGVVISTLSGLALFFFAFSGLWMYVEMYRRRSHRHSHPRRWFW